MPKSRRVQASTRSPLVGIVAKWTSQTRAGVSAETVTIRVASGLNAADFIHATSAMRVAPYEVRMKRSGPRSTAISFAVRASQIRAVPSQDAVMMRVPSGLNTADSTLRRWPRRTAISIAVVTSQIRAVSSEDAVTMWAPSGLNAAENIG